MKELRATRNDLLLIQHDLNNFCAAMEIPLVRIIPKRIPNNRKHVRLYWEVQNYWDDGAVHGFIAAWLQATYERRARFTGDKVHKHIPAHATLERMRQLLSKQSSASAT